MRKQRAAGLLCLTAIGLLSAASGQAAIVTYQASGALDQVDNPAQLPGSLFNAAVGQTMSVNFTFDTSAFGVANGPGDTSYFSPLVSEKAFVGSGAPLALGFDFSTIEITNNSFSGGLYTTGFQLVSAGTVPTDFTGTTTGFAIYTEASSAQPLNLYNDASLAHAPLKASDANAADFMAIAFTTYLDGVQQSQSDAFVSSNLSIAAISPVAAPEIDPASAASAGALLLGSLAVLSGRRKSVAVSSAA